MIQEVDAHRRYTARQIERWERKASITPEQAEELSADMEAHREDLDPSPVLAPGLMELYEVWSDLGRPVTVIQGLAGGLMDFRGQLYLARLAWLDEHRWVDPDERDVVCYLWSRLDKAEIELSLKATKDAAEEASRGS